MKTLLITLAVVLGVLLAVPAQALDSNGGRDQYGNRGVSHRAEEDAVWASGTFSVVATTESPDEGAALAAEPESGGSASPSAAPTEDNANAGDETDANEGDATGESETDSSEPPKLTKLPDTGGASPLASGILLAAGGLLVGGIALRSLSRYTNTQNN